MSATGIALPAGARPRPGRSGSLGTALCNILVGPISALMLAFMLWRVLRGAAPAFDFRYAYWSAGHRVLAGHSPYLWTASQLRSGFAFVYPALSAVVFAPTALFSRSFGAEAFTFASLALVPATLWLLRVRDWRVYGIVLLWEPVYSAWMTANESSFLMFGLACLWRWRDRPVVAGLLTAAMVSLKPLMWPLVVWLLVTRRWRAGTQALIWGTVLNLAAWSVVGFGQISTYLHAAGVDTDDSWRTGFGLPALLSHFGSTRGLGLAALAVCSVLLLVATVRSGVSKRNELQALTLTVALALVSSPLVWTHYVVLLLVPLAILRPRLSWIWAVPILLWVCQPAAPVHTWQAIVDWVAVGTMFVALGLQAAQIRPRLSTPTPPELAPVPA